LLKESPVETKDTPLFQSTLTKRQVIIGTAGTSLIMFLGSLYMTVVATAMPRIITDLGGFSQYTWVFTSFFIAETIAIPLVGKLSDRYGRKWLYIIGLIIFVVASLLSGFSQTMTQLIVFRTLQGLGFGINMSLSFIVIADLFPPEERGKYSGIMASVMAISTIIGPTIGGYLTDYLSWRWCFFMNVPLAIVIIFLFIIYFPQYRPGSKHNVDYAGAITMVIAIAPLMLALTWGGVDYEWLSPTILGMIGFSVIMFAVFFIIEKRAEEPIVPMELFKLRVITVSSITVFLLGATFMPAVTFIPLYFQGVLGTSASQSGNFLMPMMLSSVVASIICGQVLARTGGFYRLQSILGFIFMAAGFYLISKMTVDTSYTTAIINIVLTGIGAGLLMPIHTLAVQNTVPYALMGAATSLVTWLRTIGGLFGLSIVGSVMNNSFSSEFIRNLTPEVIAIVPKEQLTSMVSNPQVLVNPVARTELQSLFEGMGDKGPELFEQVLSTLQNALNTALTNVFAVLFIGVILALLTSMFLKGIPRHKHVKGELMTNTED